MKLHVKISIILLAVIIPSVIINQLITHYIMLLLFTSAIFSIGALLIYKQIQPLYKLISKLNQTVLFKEQFEFKSTSLIEVNTIAQKLNLFTAKSIDKFQKQKQYSENFSHELLTPLAIIRTKVELLLQSENLNESDLMNLDSIVQTVNKLSKINKGLILLSKINNNQFIDKNDINLNILINQTIENFKFQTNKKQIAVNWKYNEVTIINTNLNLIDILVSNLIKNAVFHNIQNGNITITLQNEILEISNSGPENLKNSTQLFERFESNKNNDNSIGLGLSIVKNICDLFNYTIVYKTSKNTHTIKVDFSR